MNKDFYRIVGIAVGHHRNNNAIHKPNITGPNRTLVYLSRNAAKRNGRNQHQKYQMMLEILQKRWVPEKLFL